MVHTGTGDLRKFSRFLLDELFGEQGLSVGGVPAVTACSHALLVIPSGWKRRHELVESLGREHCSNSCCSILEIAARKPESFSLTNFLPYVFISMPTETMTVASSSHLILYSSFAE